ncbi:MAG: hypothetical protein BWX88_02496 [Planctomycetes bacterium ADurb.Bin126]|nr:MAG: hypothetical protein BWX88_02496 [Planctomycetes bacterium ADurb.Bin126]HOD82165.1 DUF4965 domain-containing protein [Phycisphaerae bacterium]HQL72612.1 DUF4965 domain-containing protein [Phycisphaerae bacterium]
MFRIVMTVAILLAVACFVSPLARAAEPLRPPAVPLVTHDPYFSCWSTTNELFGGWPRHWTGAIQALCGMVRVDGRCMRFMGGWDKLADTVRQTSVTVNATQTIYVFDAGGVELTVTFTSPLLMDDLDVMSRPASYIRFDVRSSDSKAHEVCLYLDASGEWAVNTPDQNVTWGRADVEGLNVLRMGSSDQKVLSRAGDNLRIEWGQFYLAAPKADSQAVIAADTDARGRFVANSSIPSDDDAAKPRPVRDHWPVLALRMDLGKVEQAPVSRHVLIAYDDVLAIQYFKKNLPAWWRRGPDASAEKMLAAAEKDYPALFDRCAAFDKKLSAELKAAGGDAYERVCSLAYRQAVAAHKLAAGPEGQPLFFSKENFSNGCIMTVDVTYPSAPLFLACNPTLLKGMMDGIFHYVESGRWTKPFAPHDLGTYPLANGQVYGGDMPVEECGNMLILAAAIARVEGNADYAKAHWKALTQWASYLKDKGFDPENQLCTDDFAGHLAHNTNLSIKAIVALGGYGMLAGMLGQKDAQQEYTALARELAGRWAREAADGDHYSLTFDRKGTWSQKYNLVWDKVLGLNLFDPAIARKEVAHYLKVQAPFGLPLDSREKYTKSDWILWSATLADSREDFARLVAPVYKYLHESPSRVPASDWHWTHDGKVRGFRARSVVGGYYMKLLAEKLKR